MFSNIVGKTINLCYRKNTYIVDMEVAGEWHSYLLTKEYGIYKLYNTCQINEEYIEGVWHELKDGYTFTDEDGDVILIYNTQEGLVFQDKPIKDYWDYRVVRKTYDNAVEEGIHEVYYKNNTPHTCTVAPVAPIAIDGEDLSTILLKYSKAIEKPVIIYEEL